MRKQAIGWAQKGIVISANKKWKQKTAHVESEPPACWAAVLTKAATAGTPVPGRPISGPLNDPDLMQAHCLNREFYTPRNKGRNQIRQKPEWLRCMPGRNQQNYKHLASSWQAFCTTGKGRHCSQWACAAGRHVYCLILTETVWSRFSYEITEARRSEVTCPRSEVITGIFQNPCC